MDKPSPQPRPKRPYEPPSISRVYVDPIIDMLAVCGDPELGTGKTSPTVCETVAS